MKKDKSVTPIKKNLEEIYQKTKEGISKTDKEYLLDELAEMAKSIEEWKSNNPEDVQHKKAS